MNEKRTLLNELALFAGGGGGILGSTLIGWRTVCAVEIDPKARDVLIRRQKEGHISAFPIWDDVCTFDGEPWQRTIDVITGGFPCTNISAAGKGEGIAGKDSRLFFEMLRIIEEVRPQFVLAENSPHLRTKGLGVILSGLARLGYDAKWGVLGARHVGANHRRDRMWIIASNPNYARKRDTPIDEKVASPQGISGVDKKLTYSTSERGDEGGLRLGKKKKNPYVKESSAGSLGKRNPTYAHSKTVWEQQGRIGGTRGEVETIARITDWWNIPRFAGVDDGRTNRMDRVRITGNMQVPGVVKLAWKILGFDFQTPRWEEEREKNDYQRLANQKTPHI